MKALRTPALVFLYIAFGGFFSLLFLALFDAMQPHEGTIALMVLLPFALLSWGILEFLDFCSRRIK